MKPLDIIKPFTELISQIDKVMDSCDTIDQADRTREWGLALLETEYKKYSNNPHLDLWIFALANSLQTGCANKVDYLYSVKVADISLTKVQTAVNTLGYETEKRIKGDALFIQEIINDLHKHGFQNGGKARQMLYDWSRELGHKAGLKGKRKEVFFAEVGPGNY